MTGKIFWPIIVLGTLSIGNTYFRAITENKTSIAETHRPAVADYRNHPETNTPYFPASAGSFRYAGPDSGRSDSLRTPSFGEEKQIVHE